MIFFLQVLFSPFFHERIMMQQKSLFQLTAEGQFEFSTLEIFRFLQAALTANGGTDERRGTDQREKKTGEREREREREREEKGRRVYALLLSLSVALSLLSKLYL